jgi:hypothetical protein
MDFLNLKAILSLNGSGFQLGLKRAESQAKQFASTIKGEFARAFGAAAIVAYSKKLVDLADQITDVSDTLGISTAALQAWGNAAKLAGKNLDDVARFMTALAKSRENALGDDKSAEKPLSAFERLGISKGNLASMSLEALARQVASAVSGAKNIQDILTPLNEVGGRGASGLIPTMKGLDSGFGTIFSDETLENAKALKTEILLLADAISGPLMGTLSELGPMLRDTFTMAGGIIGPVAAYLGARSGGASHEDALKASLEAQEYYLNKREAQMKAAQDAIAARNAGAQSPLLNVGTMSESEPMKAVKEAAHQAARETMDRPMVNAWQQVGAAVRYAPDNKELIRNTAETVAQLREVVKGVQAIRGSPYYEGLSVDF